MSFLVQAKHKYKVSLLRFNANLTTEMLILIFCVPKPHSLTEQTMRLIISYKGQSLNQTSVHNCY